MNVGSFSNSTALQALQKSLFSTADADSDGNLTLTEFQSIGQNLQGGAKSPSGTTSGSALLGSDALSSLLSMQQQHKPPSLDDMFASADADGDGSLTTEELAADMAKHAPPGATASAADSTDRTAQMISDLDTDGDGKLSKDEFAAMKPPEGGPPPGGPPPGGPPGGASQASGSSSSTKTYDAADTNKDGTVSAAELAASLTSVMSALGSDVSKDALSMMTKLLQSLSGESDSGSTVSLAA